MGIDAGLLLDFACYPQRKANNVNWLHYRRQDDTTFAVAKQLTRGVWSKLAALTGMNEGNDKRFDVAADGIDDTAEIRAVCQVGNADSGSITLVERPVGTRIGAIKRASRERYVFELANGDRVGELDTPSVGLKGRAIRDASGAQVGLFQVRMPEAASVVDLVTDIQMTNDLGRTQNTASPFTALFVKLDHPPDEPLRSFVLAVPVAFGLGYRRGGTFDD